MFTHASLILGGFCCCILYKQPMLVRVGVALSTGDDWFDYWCQCCQMRFNGLNCPERTGCPHLTERADLGSAPERRKFPPLPPLLCKASVHVTSDTGQDHLTQAACASATCIATLELRGQCRLTKTSLPSLFVRQPTLGEQWCYLFKVMSSLVFTAPSPLFCFKRPRSPFYWLSRSY